MAVEIYVYFNMHFINMLLMKIIEYIETVQVLETVILY